MSYQFVDFYLGMPSKNKNKSLLDAIIRSVLLSLFSNPEWRCSKYPRCQCVQCAQCSQCIQSVQSFQCVQFVQCVQSVQSVQNFQSV